MREPPITPRALPLGLALVLGLALATPVRAQLDPPSLPDVYGEIVKTWRDTGRFIFPWERASQIISVRAHSNRYCEETDTSFLPLPVDGRLGDVGSGSAWISQVGCNYITSLGGVVPTPTEISLGIDPERDEANLFLREVALGGSWTATAVLDPTSPASPFGKLYEGGDDAAEVTNNTLTRSFTADDTYALLSGTVRLGAARGDVVAGTGWVLEDSFDCGGDLELRSADLVIRLGDGWGTTTIDASEPWLVCAVAVPNGSGAYDLDITYIDPIARTVTGVVGGLTAKASFTIEADGLHASQVAVRLPAGHTLHTARSLQVHEMIEQVPTPRGTSWVPFEGLAPAVAATLTELTATRNLGSGRFLVSREVPLGFLIDEIGLLPEGLVASAVSARYLRKLPVHRYAEDHPIRKGPRANDVALGAATPAQGIRIDGQGMRTSVTLASGTGVTALPRGTLTWPGADLAIERGALARQAQAIDAFTLEQDGGCPGCGNAGGLDRTLSLTASAGTVAGVNESGARAAFMDQGATELGFGPTIWPGTGNHRPTFLRQGDANQRAVLVLPGAVLPAADATATAARALLGTWVTAAEPTGAGELLLPRELRPLDHVETRKGNGFFAGLNLGPEIYSDAQSQPQAGSGRLLTGTTMSIAFMGASAAAVDIRDIPANAGTKLVVRGPVLGVFNTNAANAPQPQVYGYAFSFTRFAFGLVDNTLAPETWIDGKVTVAGHGDFGVPFLSLGMTCTGQLASGLVDFSRLGAPRLRAWKTPYEISSLRFTPKPPDTQCGTSPRELAVGGGVKVLSLDQPVQLEATWTPAGVPTGAKLAPIQARLDKSATTPGFLVQTKADKLTLGYKAGDADVGWFLFGAKHMVPFWDALDVQLRLQNVTSATDPGALVAAPSLVVPDPFTPDPAWQAAWTNEGNAALVAMFDASGAADATAAQKAVVDTIKLTAKRDWVIDMSGKVKWRPKKADLDQRFVAATTDSTDLTVVKVQSAIPYITHEMTQLMFGIDADVRKISNLAIPSIKIDLKDPESLKRIDDFLASSPLNISGNPLQTGLGLLRGAITSLSSTVKGLFGPTLKNLLRTVIKTAFEGLGVGDLLDLSAKAVSAIQSTAQKAIAAVFGPLRDLVDKAVSGLVSGPDEALRELYTTLPGLIADASQTADQAKAAAARAALTTANQVLDTASNALSAANGFLVGMKGKVDLAKSTLQTIKSELASKATTARCLLRNPALAPVLPNPGYSCPANQLGLINILDPSKLNFLSCDKDKNEIIKHIYNIKMKVDAVADQLAGDGNKRLDAMVKVIVAPLGVSSDGFAKTLGVLDGLAKAVKDQVGKAYNKIAGTEPGSLCSKVLGGAGNKLATLADKARTFLDTVRGVLHDAAVKVDGVLGDLLKPWGPFETFKEKLDQVAAVVSNLAGGVKNLKNTVGAYLDPNNLPSLVVSAQQVRDQMDGAAGLASSLMTGQTLKWCADPSCNPGTGSFLGIVADKLAEPVYEVIGVVESKVGAELSKALAVIPFPTKDELLQHITTLIVDSPVLDEITKLVNENLSFIEDKANELVNMVLDQLSVFLQAAFDKVHALLSGVLSAVTAAFEKFPIQAASIKGFADIMGNTLRALQVDAKFTMNKNSSSDKGGDKAANDFGAQLRVESWEANGKGQGCGVTKDAANMYDVSITAMNLPITIGGSDGLKITKLMLGFSIDQGIPIGVFGGINTTGALKVGTFQLRNIAFMAAAGLQEVYIGARAQAIFESFSGEVAFFVGRACTMKPLLELDPGTAKFIAQPNGPNSEFFGAYVHGAFQVPIFSVGCMLKLAIGAEAAIWAFKSGPGFVLGGLVGGSLTGKALCIVSIKGAIRVAVNYSSVDDKVSGSGEFFAAGGFGFSCDEDTWTSIDKVKADDGCGTVSVSASASFAPMSTGPVDTSGID